MEQVELLAGDVGSAMSSNFRKGKLKECRSAACKNTIASVRYTQNAVGQLATGITTAKRLDR